MISYVRFWLIFNLRSYQKLHPYRLYDTSVPLLLGSYDPGNIQNPSIKMIFNSLSLSFSSEWDSCGITGISVDSVRIVMRISELRYIF